MLQTVARQFVKEAIGDKDATTYLVTDLLLDQRVESNRQLLAEALPIRKLYRTIKTAVASIVLTANTTTASKVFDFAAQFPPGVTDFLRFANDFVILRLANDTGSRFICRVYDNQNMALNRSSRQSLDNSNFNINKDYVPVFFDGRNFLIADESSPVTSGTVANWQIDFAYIPTPAVLSGSLNTDRINEVHEYQSLMLAQAEIQQTNKGIPEYQGVRQFLLEQLKEVGP